MIEEITTMKKYDLFNLTSNFILQFFSKSYKLIEEHPQQNSFITHIFSLVNTFYYQKTTLNYGFYSLMKMIRRGNLKIYTDELFNTFFFNNVFSVFERSILDYNSLAPIVNLQKLCYMYLET